MAGNMSRISKILVEVNFLQDPVNIFPMMYDESMNNSGSCETIGIHLM